ncbi:acyl carrier protein [Anaeromicropila populeti]|uniref:Phosphopantetheine attachment site n=1 Tax=Anaeromicropila populeti TaxID=37658 RepID=A0A1I6LVJ7_9FIRM|nr:acyl carrier protein [Anaeromicropila populeti]SFS07473.1 Phosphopantetheine attachment site [Anaeromicropila populeti]
MNKEDICNEILDNLRKICKGHEVSAESDFNEIGIDSVKYVDFIIELESIFNIDIDNDLLIFKGDYKVKHVIDEIYNIVNT